MRRRRRTELHCPDHRPPRGSRHTHWTYGARLKPAGSARSVGVRLPLRAHPMDRTGKATVEFLPAERELGDDEYAAWARLASDVAHYRRPKGLRSAQRTSGARGVAIMGGTEPLLRGEADSETGTSGSR